MASLKAVFTDNDELFLEEAHAIDCGSSEVFQVRDQSGRVYTLPAVNLKYLVYTP